MTRTKTTSRLRVAEPTAPPGLILSTVALVQFLVSLDLAIVNVALPRIGAGLGFSPVGLTWVINAYALTFGGLLLLGGKAADRYGRRRCPPARARPVRPGLPRRRSGPNAGPAGGRPGRAGRRSRGARPGRSGAFDRHISRRAAPYPGLRGVERGQRRRRRVRRPGRRPAHPVPRLEVGDVRQPAHGRRRPDLGRAEHRSRPSRSADAAVRTCPVRSWSPEGSASWCSAWSAPTSSPGPRQPLFPPWRPRSRLPVAFIRVERTAAREPLLRLGLLTNRSVAGANAYNLVLGAVMASAFYFVTLYLQRVLGTGPAQTGLMFLPFALGVIAGSVFAVKLGYRVRSPHPADCRRAAHGHRLRLVQPDQPGRFLPHRRPGSGDSRQCRLRPLPRPGRLGRHHRSRPPRNRNCLRTAQQLTTDRSLARAGRPGHRCLPPHRTRPFSQSPDRWVRPRSGPRRWASRRRGPHRRDGAASAPPS